MICADAWTQAWPLGWASAQALPSTLLTILENKSTAYNGGNFPSVSSSMILSLPSVCSVLLEFKMGLIDLGSSSSILLPCLPIFVFSSESEEVAHTDLPNDCFGFWQHLIHCLASANLDILMILFAFPAHNISRLHSSTAGVMFVLLSLVFTLEWF